MQRRVLIYIASLCFLIEICNGGEFSETISFSNFIQAVDPEKVLGIVGKGSLRNPCLYPFKGVKCDFQANSILEIRLQNLNLSGVIDAESLCELPHLQVVNLAQNFIKGGIPNSISSCTKLRYLNLSNNLLEGSLPFALTQLKNLKKLDISNNHFASISSNFERVAKHTIKYSVESNPLEIKSNDNVSAPPPSSILLSNKGQSNGMKKYAWPYWVALVIGVVLAGSIACCVNGRNTRKSEKEKVIYVEETSVQVVAGKIEDEIKSEEKQSELVFFVNESERFTLDDLLESAADLQSQSLRSSLYKVTLKNNAVFAVKRLKKLQAPFDEFGETMKMVGSMKHRNLRPLVGYHSTDDQKLLIYKFQSNGSLLNLLENYTRGKREFSWRLRLSIAIGITRGLDYIYRWSNNGEDSIPHGNLKPSNIILSENEEPLISEYGVSKFLEKTSIYANNGYTAPEKSLTEQGDVYSLGVILLELLTGKIVEKTGIDLPKWVRSMVREEWTGEVFDKEIDKAGVHWAFPLLNISLKCVSHLPETRPSVAEVLEKIEEVIMSVQEEYSASSYSSIESLQQDCYLLHTVIPEVCETPGSTH